MPYISKRKLTALVMKIMSRTAPASKQAQSRPAAAKSKPAQKKSGDMSETIRATLRMLNSKRK